MDFHLELQSKIDLRLTCFKVVHAQVRTIFWCSYLNDLRIWSTSHGNSADDALVHIEGVESKSNEGRCAGGEVEHTSSSDLSDDDVISCDDSISLIGRWR